MAAEDQDTRALIAELEALRAELASLKSLRFEKLFVESETLNIDDQEALEIILQESEERFLCLADNAPALIWMAGADKGCFYFNQPWLHFTGRSLEQEQGNGWMEGVHPEDLRACFDSYTQAFDARQPFTLEYRLRNAAGEYRWLLDNGAPRFARNGKFLGYISCSIDITDRNEFRRAITKSEEKYRTLVESVNVIIVRWLPTGIITFINRYGKSFFGFREEEIVGKSLFESIVPKESSTGDDLEAYIADICQNPNNYQFTENENIKKNGDRVWIAWTNTPVFDDQGNIIELFASGVDITARKLAEDQLLERELELLETQRLAKLGQWKFDLASGAIYWSAEIFRMFGRDPHRGLPNYEDHVQSIDPGDRQRHQDIVDQVLATGETQDLSYRLLRQDGTPGWLWTTIEAIHNPAGKVVGLQGVAMDITRQKRAEVELERLNEELEQRVLERTEAFLQSEATLQQVNEQLKNRLQELKRRNDEMELLSTLNEYLQSCAVVGDACASVAALVPPLFPDCCGAIFLFNANTHEFEMIKSWGTSVCSQPVFKSSDCWALRRGDVHWVGEKLHDLFCNHLHPDAHPQEGLCLPLVAQGETLGLLSFYTKYSGGLNPEHQQLAKAVAEQVSLAIANIKLRERLENQSTRDPLTGLFNRRYLERFFVQEIGRANRYHHAIGVILADIDHFKQFNDQLGHDAGDYVLKVIAGILQNNIRGSDIACRYGGEEMILVLPQTSPADTYTKAESIRQAIAAMQCEYHGNSLNSLTVSLGVAGYPDHGETMQSIIQAADVALYRAKAAGRNQVMVAEPSQPIESN